MHSGAPFRLGRRFTVERPPGSPTSSPTTTAQQGQRQTQTNLPKGSFLGSGHLRAVAHLLQTRVLGWRAAAETRRQQRTSTTNAATATRPAGSFAATLRGRAGARGAGRRAGGGTCDNGGYAQLPAQGPDLQELSLPAAPGGDAPMASTTTRRAGPRLLRAELADADNPANAPHRGAGGIEAVTGAMARLPDDRVVRNGRYALGNPRRTARQRRGDRGGGRGAAGAACAVPGLQRVQRCPPVRDMLAVYLELLCNSAPNGGPAAQRRILACACACWASGDGKAAQRPADDDLLTPLDEDSEGHDRVTELTRLSAAGQRFIKRLSVAGKPSARTLGRMEGSRQPEATPDMSEITVVLNGSDVASLAQRGADPEAAQPEAAAVIAGGRGPANRRNGRLAAAAALARSRLSNYEPAFRARSAWTRRTSERWAARLWRARAQLGAVQRLQRTLEPVQPVVVACERRRRMRRLLSPAPAVEPSRK